MFDDREGNQDEAAPMSARMRFAYRLAGIDPDNDQALSGLPGRNQTGMAPAMRAIDLAPAWPALLRKPQVPQKPTIGRRMMQRDLDALPSQRANVGAAIPPKLTIGQRMMGIRPDAAFRQRNNAPAGIAPKWTIGQRMMGLDRRESRIENPQTRQGSFGGFAPTGAVPGGLEMRGNRWLGNGRSAFTPGQQAGYSPRPRGSVDMNVQTKPRIGASAIRDDWNTISATGSDLKRMGNQVPQFHASAGKGLDGSGLYLGSEGRLGFAGDPKGVAAAGAREQQQPPSGSRSPLTGEYVAGPKAQAGDTVRQATDYLKWRNQSFRPATGGGWEAPSGRLYTNQQLRELYSTQQQEAAWAEQRREQERHASAVARGDTVTITYPDGMRETRTGHHPQRDNNPGDIKYAGTFAREHGAVGVDKGFAIFPSAEAGLTALNALLRTNKYQAMSIDQAIKAFAPHLNWRGQVINDTPKYQANVRSALGVGGATKVSSLSPEQFEILKHTIAQVEGYYDKVKAIRELPRRPSVIPKN